MIFKPSKISSTRDCFGERPGGISIDNPPMSNVPNGSLMISRVALERTPYKSGRNLHLSATANANQTRLKVTLRSSTTFRARSRQLKSRAATRRRKSVRTDGSVFVSPRSHQKTRSASFQRFDSKTRLSFAPVQDMCSRPSNRRKFRQNPPSPQRVIPESLNLDGFARARRDEQVADFRVHPGELHVFVPADSKPSEASIFIDSVPCQMQTIISTSFSLYLDERICNLRFFRRRRESLQIPERCVNRIIFGIVAASGKRFGSIPSEMCRENYKQNAFRNLGAIRRQRQTA